MWPCGNTRVLTITQTALATPPSGLSNTLIGQGRFVAIDTQAKTGAWKARIDTKGASDLYVLENRFAPGGTIGWHSHPGPSMVIVKAGTATVYAATIPRAPRTWSRRARASSIRWACAHRPERGQRRARAGGDLAGSGGRGAADRRTRLGALRLLGDARERVGGQCPPSEGGPMPSYLVAVYLPTARARGAGQRMPRPSCSRHGALCTRAADAAIPTQPGTVAIAAGDEQL